jgi:menaquinone-dependent protoporphyrinogen oxidase
MTGGILVAYATAAGSTAEVAEAIGEELRSMGAEVDVRLAKEVKDVSPYGAVIVGSGIRAGQLLPHATKFVQKNREALSQVPVAYFVVCLTMKDDTEENRSTVAAYLDPLRELVEPMEVGLFAGAVNPSSLSIPARTILKAMKISEGDYRDWEAIRSWARALHPKLAPG